MGNSLSSPKRRECAIEGDDSSQQGRPSKRSKIREDSALAVDTAGTNYAAAEEGITSAAAAPLPPEIWARAMDFLDCGSILSCSAASCQMLRVAAPLVTALHVDRSSEINAALAQRFRGVREVNIYSILKGGESDDGESDSYVSVDNSSMIRAMPFLSRFPFLEKIFFGGKTSSGEIVTFGSSRNLSPRRAREYERRVHGLIDMMSGLFCFGGASAEHICVLGLCCPLGRRSSSHRSYCEVCTRACRSFPLQQVINFESRGSSSQESMNVENGACHIRLHRHHLQALDVCLARSQIESIVEHRPGGFNLLQSDARFLRLLGQGRCYEIRSWGDSFYIAAYSDEQIIELKRVIQYARLQVKAMDKGVLTRAAMRCFAKDGNELLPPGDRCFHAGVLTLKDSIDLPIPDEDFLDPVLRNSEIWPHIVNGVKVGPIRHFCLMLLQRLVKSAGCDAVIISGAMSQLLRVLTTFEPDNLSITLWTLQSFLSSASHAQQAAIFNPANRAQHLLELLSHSSPKMQERALDVLKLISDKALLIQLFVKNNAYQKLVTCTSSHKLSVRARANSIISRLMEMDPSGHEPKRDDALLYLDQVKMVFDDQPCIYNKFLEIMKSFNAQEVNTIGVINRVRKLFHGHDHLMLGFNTFLPDEYDVEMSDLESRG